MPEDYDWLRGIQDRIRSRRAAQYPDEEPDEDAVTAEESIRRKKDNEAAVRKAENDRKERGFPPQLGDQA